MNIVGIGKKFVNLLPKAKTTSAAAIQPTAVPAPKLKTDLFCHQYWDSCAKQGIIRQTSKESVSLHGELNGINHHFIRSPYPEHMNQPFSKNGCTPREMIYLTDVEFKSLKPIDKKMTVFRCIAEKPEFFSEYPLYLKRTKIKKGDIIDMKEYAYATSDISYAKGYLPDNKGILYEIEIPEKAKVSRIGNSTTNEVTFPRSSKYECTDVKKVQDNDNDYLHIKLRYILPD